MSRIPLCLVTSIALLCAFESIAYAQNTPESPNETPPQPIIVPPQLIDFVEAIYPAEAETQNLTANVDLILVIAVDGTVTDAQVVTPVGNGFDEAAIAAAMQFRFQPATRDGVPMPARIRYRYVFELRAENPAPVGTAENQQQTSGPGRISGQVLAEDEQPIQNAFVTLTNAEGEARNTNTANDGTFVFESLTAGLYSLTVSAPGLGETTASEEVLPNTDTHVTYRITPANRLNTEEDEPIIGARAVVDPPPREVTRRTIPRELLTRIPGTRGDALRAVELLPGVARPPFGLGVLIVRGSAPTDTEILLDGVPVPSLYHFGGLTSFMNSRLLDRIDFFPGNFSSRYGRRIGGVLEVSSRDPATDRIHGVADISAIDASLLLEGPIGRNAAIAGSFRRSMIDLVFGAFLPEGSVRITAAPVYYDYQLITTWRPTDRDRVKVRFYGSSDAFRLILGDDFSSDPDIRGNGNLITRFNSIHASWDRTIGSRTEQSIVVQTGPTHLQFGLSDEFLFQGDFWNIYTRAEWKIRLLDHLRIITGMDVNTVFYDIAFRGPPPTASEGDPGNQSLEQTVEASIDGIVCRPGLYFDLGIDLDDRNSVLNLGFRFDYFGELDHAVFDPRLALQVQVLDNLRLKGGLGLYSQPPEYQESSPVVGNPNLEPIRSLHSSIGLDYRIADEITIGAEGFFKYLWNRVINTEDGAAPFFENGGIGRIYGTEISGQIMPQGRPYFGYLSYTLMRSERRDRQDEQWRLFDYDQTHIFTASFTYSLPRHWEIGSTLRFVSGNPYTPVIGSIYDPVGQSYLPINGAINSIRNPYFNRLDIRVEKQWVFEGWKLALYLDVQNVYNRQNREGIVYNYDYTELTSVSGLPIIPALGIRGEL